jgi:hypothetical protein
VRQGQSGRPYVSRIRVVVAIAAAMVASPASPASNAGGRSAATITGSFADSCRDFATRSSKDISYVEAHHRDGRVARTEGLSGPEYAIDGQPGDELEVVTVKSGTTTEQFDCVPSNAAPSARLEIQTPPVDQTPENCHDFFAGGLLCQQSSPRTAWTSQEEIPDDGGGEPGVFHWGCGGLGDPSMCPSAVTFRGSGSHDPDGDITSWTLDFGDGTSASGSWSTALPYEVSHEYPRDPTACGMDGLDNVCLVTLTVTDSAGQSHASAMVMAFVDQRPD